MTGGAATWRRRFVDAYLSMDPRSLGLARIVVALVLIADLVRRIPDLTLWYTNQGLTPNHMMLWRPPTQWMFSPIFFPASNIEEAVLGFVFCGVVFLLLLVGWRTRLMQVLALACVLSLHGRSTFVENGGDWTLAELALWSAFLPLGRRFSVDAVLASLRRRREVAAAELEDRAALGPEAGVRPVVTLAALALVLQLANAYFFNAVHKGGPTWREGSAVHYVIHQDRMVTWFGVWLRPHMTLTLSRVLSWGALATEGALPALLLFPTVLFPAWRRVMRRLAIVFVIGLHGSFQCFINLGIFSFAMIGYTPFLLGAADWELFGRLEAGRTRQRLTAYFDSGCGLCFQAARVLARLDRFARVKFVAAEDPEPDSLVVVDDATGRRYTRADGLARVLAALPVGFLFAWPLRLPGLRALANLAYGAVARRRRVISTWLGLRPCGVPAMGRERQPVPLVEKLRAVVPWLREAAVAVMVVVLVTETLFINAAVPRFLKVREEPLWIKQLVAYPRLIQAWSMFASDAPTTDESVVVDAITVDGRHVDPYSEVAGRYPHPGTAEIPPRLDNDSFFFNYSSRIPFRPEYFGGFEEWIKAYHERTGRPTDRIVSFNAYIVEDDSPPPGETRPRNVRSRIFLSFPRR
jgi:predicted DCC family thiol-disulfide oxidoreductase YuxK